ncbi:DUF4124 domain-containing protein [Methylotenera sp.]|uniref:DUF4124 domain-containing protein n=1 Tax=Methylotenera sp. TaxID=2051956 RepID=UPI00272F7D3A|nr:DUF4124 domain-containing protein [Methylotenera sp.]MDP2071772.1 DUF4124 domain-containing protein [Methylotenera sp.]MDP3006411.1 DUF4124 domain-containing protein [Methylotenera sp.]
MLRILLVSTILLPTLLLSTAVLAEIYKWKDKNGVVRYSDVPPPSNVKLEDMHGKKSPKPTGLAPLTAVEGDGTVEMNKAKASAAKSKADADKTPLSKDEAAAKRAKDAEQQKKADEAKQAELKIKQENCTVAKQNLATFTNGGRIAKTNEKGEKQYLGDADISQGKADAQRDVEKYCD